MTHPERKSEAETRPLRRPAERHEDGVLESVGKAISSPIAGASGDELLPLEEDTPPQRRVEPSKRSGT